MQDLVAAAAVLFNLVVLVSSILIVVDGIMLKADFRDTAAGLQARVDRIYIYGIILASSLGLSLLARLAVGGAALAPLLAGSKRRT